MSHEEARNSLSNIGSVIGDNRLWKYYNNVKNYILQQEQHTATIRECISLLLISGENTKSVVIEKLRGIVE